MTKKKTSRETTGEKDRAPWTLQAMTGSASEDDQMEPMAYVRTPEGDGWVPLSEAKDKVNPFDQLPEYKKKLFARHAYEMIRKQQEEESRLEEDRAVRDDPEKE